VGKRTEYTYDNLYRRVQVKDAQGGLAKTTYSQVDDVLKYIRCLIKKRQPKLLTAWLPLSHFNLIVSGKYKRILTIDHR
jgi:hypothetical protein